jgi:hypothetical protein
VRRRIALSLVVLGLVALVVGTGMGCGRLFSFNGRHPLAVRPIVPGTPIRETFPAKAGKRYTIAVHAVFEREGLPEANGALVVEAQLPIIASIEDTSGVAIAKIVGSLDPNEPPTVLYGQDANPRQRRPAGVAPAELVAERLLGPYTASADRDVTYAVDLAPDRIGKARLREARVVLYDDALPTSITVAFVSAVAGGVALVIGAMLLLFGLYRARRSGAGARRPRIV